MYEELRYRRQFMLVREAIPALHDWRCEQIGPDGTRCKARQGEPHPITGSKVVLTTAHLDHTPEHVADHNLLACCQRCHLAYDLEHHRRNAAKRRRQEMATAEMFGAANAQ